MIAPTQRLLMAAGLGVIPLSLLAAIRPEATGGAAIAFAALVLVVLLDMLRAANTLAGLEVEAPPVLRLIKDRAGTLELRLKNAAQQRRAIRLALAAPGSLGAQDDERDILLPAGAEYSRFTWEFRPTRRGRHFVRQVFLEGVSPFGFWVVRGQRGLQSEIRVYPNLARERHRLSALFLNRGMFGCHALRQVGKGREFEQLREYLPGDGFEDIHWKATARRGRPITKVFQIEKTQEVYVILDASRLSARLAAREHPPGQTPSAPAAELPPEPENALERFVTAALVLGLAAERQGDLFGLLSFTDKIESFIRAKNGRQHYQACRDALYTLNAREVTPDFDEVAAFIRLRLRRRALLVFLTALDDPVLAESFARNMNMLCRQHLIVINMLRPPLARPLFSEAPVTGADDLYQHLAGHLQWSRLGELERALGHRGVKFNLVDNERLCVEVVSQYLGVKRRQLI
jgi:uncharacterized protein (DUF58 family)